MKWPGLLLCLAACGAQTAVELAGEAPPASEAVVGPSLSAKVGQNVVLDGTARNAKAGAVVVVEPDESPVYLSGLTEWPEGLDGKKVRVEGTLTEQKWIPDPVAPNGEISQGAEGNQWVLEASKWEEVH